MLRILKALLVGGSMMMLSSCGDQPTSQSSTRSITPKDVISGKWMATVSVGGGVPTGSTLALRNELVNEFSKVNGGIYNHVIDMDDKRPKSIAPTKSNILREVGKMKDSIAAFKAQNPGAPTMVMFGLTGHGMTSGGTYYYQAEDEMISGTEIAQMLSSLGSDETVLIVQSCQSGSLPNRHLPNGSVSGLAAEIQRAAPNMQLSVVTPVSESVNSPLDVWEEEILRVTFQNAAADKSGDGIVTYEEWKNYLLQTACRNPNYVGGTGGSEGIDPQFYDANVPAGLPLYLTALGVQKYQNNTLSFPAYDRTPATLWSETTTICSRGGQGGGGDQGGGDQGQDPEEGDGLN